MRLEPGRADSSADLRRLAGPVVVVAGIAVGLAAEAALYEWSDVRHWVADLVVGLGLIGAGVTTLHRRPAVGGSLVDSQR